MSQGSRYLNQFQYTLEKDTVTLYGSFQCDGYGNVTEAQGGGIASIANSGPTTGTFQIVLNDGWNYGFGIRVTPVKSTASSIVGAQILMTDADFQAAVGVAGTAIDIGLLSATGTLVNPAVGEVVRFELKMRRSEIGPYDANGIIT